jgi:hypothetical protein
VPACPRQVKRRGAAAFRPLGTVPELGAAQAAPAPPRGMQTGGPSWAPAGLSPSGPGGWQKSGWQKAPQKKHSAPKKAAAAGGKAAELRSRMGSFAPAPEPFAPPPRELSDKQKEKLGQVRRRTARLHILFANMICEYPIIPDGRYAGVASSNLPLQRIQPQDL